MTPQILPTEPKEILIAGQYTKSEWLQLTDIERREISYNRYLQNVASAPKVNYDSLILSALYEIIYYISNGLFEAFNVVKGDVTANVIVKDENDFVVQIQTPAQYFQICDDKDLFFTKLNVKTFEKLVGSKTAKLLKSELPTETVSTTNEVFEIGKSSCKKLSAIQVKTYSTPKECKAIYSNTSHHYWTINIASNNEIFFKPVNAVDFKINLEYFAGFEFFYFESRDFVTVTEKTTGMIIVKNYKNESMNEKLFKISENQKPFAEIIANSTKKQPFTIEPNESIESINQKRIAQNEFYVFGTTPEVEPITETQPETAFSEISGLEKSFAKNYINAELKTRNIESLINEFETALLTCKESDKKSYYYALNELKNLTETQPETNEENEPATKTPATAKTYRVYAPNNTIKFAGTNEPSFFNSLESAIEKCDFDKGEKVFEYCMQNNCALWEVCVDKRYLQPTNQNETMQPQPTQPQPLTVGQSIQCDGYRLVVTDIKEAKQAETQENDATIKALKKISGTKWVGNTIHDTLDKCLTAINLNSTNSGWYNPKAKRIPGLTGIYMINQDDSIFCEARIIKEAEKRYRIEYLTKTGWCEFERLYCQFIAETQPTQEPENEPTQEPSNEPIKPKNKMNFYPTTEKVTVENYPYGYTAKTTAFYSVEFKKGFGFRKVFQTVNPKTGRLNNPKNGSYHTAVLLNKNEENGHIESYVLSFNGTDKINSGCKFMALYFDCFTSDQIKYIYKELYTYIKASFQAQVIYCGSSVDAVGPYFKDALQLAAKGFNTGENVFSEIVLDIPAIEALKVPDFQPFKITRYEAV